MSTMMSPGTIETCLGAVPSSWNSIGLDDENVFEFGSGLWTGKKPPFVRSAVLRNTNFRSDGKLDVDDVAVLDVEARSFPEKGLIPGDILVERSGGGPRQPVGRVVIFKGEISHPVSFSNFTSRLRIIDLHRIDPQFVLFSLLLFHLQGGTVPLQHNTTGIRNLRFDDYKRLRIPLPGFQEQRAIAAVLSKIQGAIETQDKLIAKLKELKSATMAKLFREGLRGERLKQTEIGEMPESWSVQPIGGIFHVELGKMLSPKSQKGRSPRPYLRNKNVQWGRFDLTDVKTMDFSDSESTRFSVRDGDILVCEGGEPGRAAVWEGQIDECFYQKALHRLRPRRGGVVLPLFYVYWAQTAFTLFRTHKPSGTKTTIAHLPKEKLEPMEMCLPEIDEQQKIVEILELLDRKLRQSESASNFLKDLFASSLELLMSGKLRVPIERSLVPA